jgi:hypothetical protein
MEVLAGYEGFRIPATQLVKDNRRTIRQTEEP